MTVYFGGSISGGREHVESYQKIVKYIQAKGHHVPTEHVAKPDVLEMEDQFTAEEIYNRDVKWLQDSHYMVAEVTNPSLGVGYEICYALFLEKPVLCLYQKKIFLTRMISGNTSPYLTVNAYESDQDWKAAIDRFLL